MAVERTFTDDEGTTAPGKGPIPTTPVRQTYDLHGCTLTILSEDPAVAAFLDPILAPLMCDPLTVRDWTISLVSVDAIDIPQGGSRLFEGTLPEGLPAVIIEDENRRSLIVDGHFAINLSPTARMVELRYVNGRSEAMGGTASFWMLGDILAAQSQHLLHGAAVVDPRSDEVIALFAPSGTGKTTTALALARSGLQLAADDALVMSVHQNVPLIWGIPRRLKVSRKTASMLPWLSPCLTENWTDGEQAIDRDALAALVTLARPEPRRVGRVIVLTPPNDHDHLLTPMAKPDALTRIAHDNFRIAPGGVEPDKAAAFAALSTLIATTPVVALSPGPRLSTLATRVFEVSDGRG
jgi:hypothetical protein